MSSYVEETNTSEEPADLTGLYVIIILGCVHWFILLPIFLAAVICWLKKKKKDNP